MGIFYFIFSVIFCRELEVEFISDSPWLYGNNWPGGTSFWLNSIAVGSGFVGQSTLDYNQAVNIDIRFSTHADSQSVAPVYESIPDTGVFLGMGTFPGTAWDVSNPNSPRRINLCFFEERGKANQDLIWNPVNVANGNYEYLIIMLSDYDEGSMYADLEAYNMEVQYFCWLKKKAGQTWFGSEPAVLQFRNFWDIEFNAKPGDNQINLEWQHENQDAELAEIEHYEIYRGLNNQPDNLIAEIDVGVNSYLDSDVINLTTYYYKVIGINNAGEPLVISDVIMSMPFLVAFNTEFISNWNGSNDNPYLDWGLTNYNDVWGYTDGEGTEYALLGAWNGTHIIDISSDPSNPEEVGFIPGSFSTHRDIKTYSHYMYVGTEANIPDPDSDDDFITPQGIQVVDLSDPQNAFLISEWNGVVQSHNIMEADGYLYVIGAEAGEDYNDGSVEAWGLHDLIILDLISNPASPELIGSWNGDYLHDVCIYEDILYGCGIMTSKMYAFDISDKTSPQKIHEWSGVPSAHACWVSEDGNTLYTGQETTNGNIKSWDVTEIENGNVNLLDEWTPPSGENWSAHNLFVKGNYLYISYYVYGLQILDISDPTNMIYIGHYDTFVESSSSGIFDGAWGAYPYFDSNTVIVSDRYTGLYIVDFDPSNLSLNSEPIFIPDQISIQNIYPNPFNPVTMIEYSLPYASNVLLVIYDLMGRQVDILYNGIQHPNNYTISWDASNYSSGVYFIKMNVGDSQSFISQSQKVVLLK